MFFPPLPEGGCAVKTDLAQKSLALEWLLGGDL